MKKFAQILASIFILFSMILTACGGAATTAESTAATTPEATKEMETPTTGVVAEATTATTGTCPAGVEGKSIEMWSPFTGPDGDEMTALAEQFSKDNPCKITVTHVAQPDYVQKLTAGAAANQLPAMTAVRAINVAELAARKVLKPFSNDVMAVFGNDVANDFPPMLWNVGMYKGERYSFPLDTHPLIMFYNKDMFKAAGVTEPGTTPWTPAEFEDALTKLEASGVKPISLGTAFQAAALWQALIRQYGGNLTDEAGTKATYDSEAGVKALEKIKELRDKYTPDVSGANDPEVNLFKQGGAAIVFHGPWHISDLQQLPFVGFAPLPQIGDKAAVTWGGSHQLALTSDDPATQMAAAMWIKWLSENSMNWAKAGQVPARNSVRNSPDMATAAAPISKVAESANTVALLPQVPAIESALWDQFGAVIDGFLTGEVKDLPTALKDAAARSQKTMDENLSTYGE